MKKFFQILRKNLLFLQLFAMTSIVFFSAALLCGSNSSDGISENSLAPLTSELTEVTSCTYKKISKTSITTEKTTTTTSATTTTSTTTTTAETTTFAEYIIEETPEPDSEETPEKTYLGTFRITHYCPCEYCCGAYTGITASGAVAVSGHTIGMSSNYAFGTKIEINGTVYTVEDRGGFAEDTIDIFCDTHEEAIEKGCYYAEVYMLN